MTTADAATIAAIRQAAAQRIREAADALALIQSPIGRPSDNTAVHKALTLRNEEIHRAAHLSRVLTVQEAADAASISRQRAYAIIQREQEIYASVRAALKYPPLPAPVPANPAHTRLPETDV